MSVPPPVKTPAKSLSQSSTKPDSVTTSDALYNFKLLSALRSDDPTAVQPFLDELDKSHGAELSRKIGQLLGMAVRVASAPIIHLILSSPALLDPNAPVSSSSPTTALHVASEIGRVDAVQLLFDHPSINDTIRDEQGRTALECASNHEVSAVIEGSRTALQLKYMAQLASYISSPLNSLEESNAMVKLLDGPRTEIVNLSALDEKSGSSLLHEAARRRDLRLVELAMKRGADVFVRDKRGKRVLEGEKGADERIKVFLRQFNNQDNLVQSKSDGRPPELKGFLSKWVNYRSGWRTRWFVLENGVLSYYRNREDEHVACRGSIAMAVATLHPSSDGSRFEVHSQVHSSVPKMIVKSSHRAEIARWIQTIKLNIDYHRQHEQLDSTASVNRSSPKRTTSFSSTLAAPGVARNLTTSSLELPPTDSFVNPALQRTTTSLSMLSVAKSPSIRSASPARSNNGDDAISILEAADRDSLLGGDEQPQSSAGVLHVVEFDLAILNIKAQIDLAQQLTDSLASEGSVAQTDTTDNSSASTHPNQRDVTDALKQSLATLSKLVSQQSIMTQNRERYYVGRIQREVEARKLWEENMLTVAKQQAEVDEQLNQAARVNEKKRKALRQARGVLDGLRRGSTLPTSPLLETPPITGSTTDLDAAVKTPTSGIVSPTPGQSISNIQEIEQAHQAVAAADSDSDDEADEFFDAIEQNTIANLSMHESIANPDKERAGTPLSSAGQEKRLAAPVPGSTKITDLLARSSLQPYLHVRHKLPIDDDKRPSVSLWSILKSSVGKDLTKISFPVSFNECTSMLQRMAEDMEYDACLTVAASQSDSARRMAFVAAFAMSNYSSTIGRIAKPFNPLLSQSFEYAIPNRYRYISEQVSHHPPASACYCEAPTWKYFGEVDAQNKFQGRSFEIRPTGVAHAELVIPKQWVKEGQDYPDAGAEYPEGQVIEHYSWKKVTTNISNFIMGSPIIDHYGDLVVTNHRTGETCTLTFKPRGWRGANAFEIKGTVYDTEGQSCWDIAGRWDTQLVARRSGSDSPLHVDTQFGDSQKEYLLLWRNSEKPKAPFNLTPYAVTLNDIPSGLEQYLCPTDCRLRTDQRAFENAEYDRAQGLKTANEEKQRHTRKLRAEGKLPPHEPRWFVPTTDRDTQEKLWEPKRDDKGEVLFWSRREEAGKTGEWDGVDTIFATD